jgi:hypothetical protein
MTRIVSCTRTDNIAIFTYDNAEVPNVATSQPKKATDTTPPTTPTLDTDLDPSGIGFVGVIVT